MVLISSFHSSCQYFMSFGEFSSFFSILAKTLSPGLCAFFAAFLRFSVCLAYCRYSLCEGNLVLAMSMSKSSLLFSLFNNSFNFLS